MNNIITDIGENFEYIKTIAQNKVELKKLDLVENASDILAYFILFLVAFILASLFSIMSLIGLTIWLSHLLNSYPTAIGLVALGLFLLILFVVFFRNQLIFRPIKNLLFSSILK